MFQVIETSVDGNNVGVKKITKISSVEQEKKGKEGKNEEALDDKTAWAAFDVCDLIVFCRLRKLLKQFPRSVAANTGLKPVLM